MSPARPRSEEKSGSTRSIPSISAVGNMSPTSTITIRPSRSRAVMFFPISPSPPRGRIRSLPLTRYSGGPAGDEQALSFQRGPHDGALLTRGRDHRQAHRATDDAHHLQCRLRRDRVRRHGEHLVDRMQLSVELMGARRVPALVRLVDRAHFRADHVRGDQDPAAPPHLQRPQEDLVVAGEQVEPLDRPELVVVCLLHGDDVVDIGGKLGHEIRGEVDDAARGDVVEDHRGIPGGSRDRLEVRPKARAVGLVVVRRHDQHGVGAQPAGTAGELDGVVGVVRARAADEKSPAADLLLHRTKKIELLLVGERGRLTGRAGDHEPVGPLLDEAARQRAGGVEVEGSPLVEGRHHRGDHARDQGHTRIIADQEAAATSPADAPAKTGGRRSAHGCASSSWEAARISRSSRPKAATRWTPTGRPSGVQWRGSEIAGWPVALKSAVIPPCGTAALYASNGSSPESSWVPSGTGGSAIVGVSRRSKPDSYQPATTRLTVWWIATSRR